MYVNAYMHACIDTYIDPLMHTCTYINKCAYTHVCMHIHVCRVQYGAGARSLSSVTDNDLQSIDNCVDVATVEQS